VNSGKIESAGPCPADAADLTRFTAIPGLIDAHTHLTCNINEPVAQAARGAATVTTPITSASSTTPPVRSTS
jgi:imidazolonepropionase-like amidohydrolase